MVLKTRAAAKTAPKSAPATHPTSCPPCVTPQSACTASPAGPTSLRYPTPRHTWPATRAELLKCDFAGAPI